MTLVHELRRRRLLGQNIARGKPPKKPAHIYFWGLPWGVKLIAALVALWLTFYVFIFIGWVVEESLAIGVALAILWLLRPVRAAFGPLLRGEPFAGRELIASSPLPATFAYGALPTAAAFFLAPYPEIACAALAAGFAFRPAAIALDGKRLPANPFAPPAVVEDVPPDLSTPGPFSLWVGESTGRFSELSSRTGIAPNEQVVLDVESACRGIATVGGAGSGKSRKVVLPLLVQMLDHGAGGLVFDVKGDDLDGVLLPAANLTGRTIHRLGLGGLRTNIIGGLSPDTAGALLESCLRAQGQASGDGAIWTNLAVRKVTESLVILSCSPSQATLRGVYQFAFDADFRDAAIARAEVVRDTTPSDDVDSIPARRLRAALDYERNFTATTDPRQISSINLSLETALGKFADPVLANAFCSTTEEANLDRMLDGDLFVVNVPAADYAGSARTVYRLIVQRFQMLAKTRARMAPGPRRDTPLLFLADEAQSILAPGDEDFHSVCRSLNVVSVVASQSLEAYEDALGGESAAGKMLGNFASKIAFRSTPKSMSWIAEHTGQIDFWKLSENGSKTNNPPFLGFIPIGASTNKGRTVTEERRDLIGPALFAELEPEECVALLEVGRRRMDDILRVPYISDEMLAKR